jgi:hypothetical protein
VLLHRASGFCIHNHPFLSNTLHWWILQLPTKLQLGITCTHVNSIVWATEVFDCYIHLKNNRVGIYKCMDFQNLLKMHGRRFILFFPWLMNLKIRCHIDQCLINFHFIKSRYQEGEVTEYLMWNMWTTCKLYAFLGNGCHWVWNIIKYCNLICYT